MNKNILYDDKKIEVFLNIFLEDDNEKVFELMKKLGITTDNIFFHDLSTETFLGEMYYKFNCKIGDKKIIFNGNFVNNNIFPNFIAVTDKKEKNCYSYNDGKIKKFDDAYNVKNNSKLMYYETLKNKKYLKKYFLNDSEYEKRLISILKEFDIDYGVVYVHSLSKHKDFYQDALDFSFICNCNDENNSILKFDYSGNGSRITEVITLKNNEGIKSYSFDCLLDTLYKIEEPKVKVIK